MEFWGIEVKGDKPVKVSPEERQVVHLSQATLVDSKKGSSENVTIFANVGTQKLAIGILNADKFPQVSFDLVFEQEFEISHSSKNGNVHLTGYKSEIQDETDDEDIDDYDEEEMAAAMGAVKPISAPAVAPKAKAVAGAAAKDSKPTLMDSDEDESEDEDDSDEADSDDSDASDKVMGDAEAEDDDSDDSEEEEETPVKSAGGKKRANPAVKTPDAKKAKLVTPLKSDGKKSVGGHVATPHPSKKEKSPKSAATGPACGPCKKTFNSQGALDSHTKAKHSATK